MNTVNTRLRVVERAEYLMPGSFFSETYDADTHGKSVEQLAREVEANVFAIQTYKVLEGSVRIEGKTVQVRSERFDVSPRTYVGGTVYTIEQLKALPGDHKILISNISQYPSRQAIQCRTGNWQPFEPDRGEMLLAVG